MSIEENRKRWEEEQKRKAKAKRLEEAEFLLREQQMIVDQNNLRRSKSNTLVYNAVVAAFGEDEAKKIKWISCIQLPPQSKFGDLAAIGDLKLFSYHSSLCLYDSDENWVRIDEHPVTAEMIFAAEAALKKKVLDAKRAEHERLEREQAFRREAEIARYREAAEREAAACEKSAKDNILSQLWLVTKQLFRKSPSEFYE